MERLDGKSNGAAVRTLPDGVLFLLILPFIFRALLRIYHYIIL